MPFLPFFCFLICLEAAHTAAQVDIAGLREEIMISRTYTEGLLVQLGELRDRDRERERERAGQGEGLRRALAMQQDEVRKRKLYWCVVEWCSVV